MAGSGGKFVQTSFNGAALVQSQPGDAGDNVAGDIFFAAAGAGTDALTANSIASGTPSVGTPTLGQVHTLTATSVSSGTPSVGSPAIGQVHALAAGDVSAGTPSVGAPELIEEGGVTPAPPGPGPYLLQETGFRLLQEDGFGILLETAPVSAPSGGGGGGRSGRSKSRERQQTAALLDQLAALKARQKAAPVERDDPEELAALERAEREVVKARRLAREARRVAGEALDAREVVAAQEARRRATVALIEAQAAVAAAEVVAAWRADEEDLAILLVST